ncbi:MAG: hypothetical protein ACE15D_19175 [Candidatus Eisenbacteria bacterium]
MRAGALRLVDEPPYDPPVDAQQVQLHRPVLGEVVGDPRVALPHRIGGQRERQLPRGGHVLARACRHRLAELHGDGVVVLLRVVGESGHRDARHRVDRDVHADIVRAGIGRPAHGPGEIPRTRVADREVVAVLGRERRVARRVDVAVPVGGDREGDVLAIARAVEAPEPKARAVGSVKRHLEVGEGRLDASAADRGDVAFPIDLHVGEREAVAGHGRQRIVPQHRPGRSVALPDLELEDAAGRFRASGDDRVPIGTDCDLVGREDGPDVAGLGLIPEEGAGRAVLHRREGVRVVDGPRHVDAPVGAGSDVGRDVGGVIVSVVGAIPEQRATGRVLEDQVVAVVGAADEDVPIRVDSELRTEIGGDGRGGEATIPEDRPLLVVLDGEDLALGAGRGDTGDDDLPRLGDEQVGQLVTARAARMARPHGVSISIDLHQQVLLEQTAGSRVVGASGDVDAVGRVDGEELTFVLVIPLAVVDVDPGARGRIVGANGRARRDRDQHDRG